MGPRSENRGYVDRCRDWSRPATGFNGSTVREPWLWSNRSCAPMACERWLQWVHGPRTVVMHAVRMRDTQCSGSFNGSTVREPWLCRASRHAAGDQPCCFNGSTVREPWLCCQRRSRSRLDLRASMGPPSENRGYGIARRSGTRQWQSLQWVRRPRTPVMAALPAPIRHDHDGFNGSTVRERRL